VWIGVGVGVGVGIGVECPGFSIDSDYDNCLYPVACGAAGTPLPYPMLRTDPIAFSSFLLSAFLLSIPLRAWRLGESYSLLKGFNRAGRISCGRERRRAGYRLPRALQTLPPGRWWRDAAPAILECGGKRSATPL